jgi:hypothetical protein
MGNVHVDAQRLAGGGGAAFDLFAVAADQDPDRTGRRALVLDAEGDRLRLADDAVARRGDQRDAAVALVGPAGDQRMDRRLEAERSGVRR